MISSRKDMVKHQIQRRGVRRADVLKAMEDTPRELFVPEELKSFAFQDSPLPIGHNQTISQPFMVAAMTELLDTAPEHKVLEAGTGSGYQTAILSLLVDTIYTVEIIPALSERAASRFQQLGLTNIVQKVGDAHFGWTEHAPFDRIMVTAAPKFIPPDLINQLKPGGKMVIPVGDHFTGQVLTLVEKDDDGNVIENPGMPVQFVPLVGG